MKSHTKCKGKTASHENQTIQPGLVNFFYQQNSLKFSQVMYAESHAFTQGHMLMHEQHYDLNTLTINYRSSQSQNISDSC
jgi:hypothetical protein